MPRDMNFDQIALRATQVIEALGMICIIVGVVWGVFRALQTGRVPHPAGMDAPWYIALRDMVGRGILLGLELLLAADIIRSIVFDPTLESVATLGLLVLIRFIISVEVTTEIEGRLPWQPPASLEAEAPDPSSEQPA